MSSISLIVNFFYDKGSKNGQKLKKSTVLITTVHSDGSKKIIQSHPLFIGLDFLLCKTTLYNKRMDELYRYIF